MTAPALETAKLYTVSEPLDRPVNDLIQGETEIPIQFNPSSLRVALANAIKENESSGNSRASQYIDKSSSTLTVELIFDTSLEATGDSGTNTDVRQLTHPITRTFMYSEAVGDQNEAPKRCLFAWGTFAFVGIMESFDETLEFFSPEGTPLRSSVSIKLAESRFQFRDNDARAAQRDTPSLSNRPDTVDEANESSGKDPKDWRETAMYNGEESPRSPSKPSLSVPTASVCANLSASASIGGGFSAKAGIGISGGLSASASGGVSANLSSPAFSFGASASLGSNIPGAFSANIKTGGGIPASGIISGSVGLDGAQLSTSTKAPSWSASSSKGGASAQASASLSPAGASLSANVGFD